MRISSPRRARTLQADQTFKKAPREAELHEHLTFTLDDG
jgi:hypothetical protein